MKTKSLIIFLIYIFSTKLNSQNSPLESSYKSYSELPREVVYAHLNKTTLVKGEDLGFTAYVTDKASKQLSQVTKNLYCVVTDKNDSIVKQQLLKVDKGITSGIVKIDSLFTSGNYTVKAYTNYMRNFKEHNHFVQQIRVIDPDKEKEITSVKVSKQLDVQLLPEGGHLVADITNVMGVIVKDSLGFGVGNLTGVLKDSQGNIITDFKLNHLGIGRFLITPKSEEDYYVDLNIENSEKIPVKNIKDKGIGVQISNMGNKVALSLQTNAITHENLKNNTYALAVHNGHQIETLPISFSEQQKVIKIFNKTDLFTGINIFTLFDQNNKPLLERLYFNYNGVNIEQSETESKVTHAKDTATVTLKYKNINPIKFNNFSISVLPAETKSYGAHHNIISQTHLQPYVKGYIEDAQYYFTNINKKKQYDLDNLLLTQGWSAYSWEDVFNNPPKQEHDFDTGISIKVIPEKQKQQQLWVHPINESAPEFLSFSKEEKGFIITEKYPLKVDSIKISKVQIGGHLIIPKVRLESYPNTISRLEDDTFTLTPKTFNRKQQTVLKVRDFDNSLLSTTQELDEVVITATKEEERRAKIKAITQGRVDFFSEGRNNFPSFINYIQTRGFLYNQDRDIIYLNTRDELKSPAFYINDIRVRHDDIQLKNLYHLPLNEFDYVVINRSRRDFPFWTDSETVLGVVKIYLRDPRSITIKGIRKRSAKFMPSLTFEPKKTFYNPKYQSYQDEFFKEYGVIDWLPENNVNENGELQIVFPDLEQEEVKLFVEGITNNGTFISEMRKVNLSSN